MTSNELLKCLTDRPCSVCKFHKEEGCSKWSCVFEEKSGVPKGEYIKKEDIKEFLFNEGIYGYERRIDKLPTYSVPDLDERFIDKKKGASE